MKKSVLILVLALSATGFLTAESNIALNLSAELGFTGIIDHRIQSGTVADKGDIFDYVDRGGQDVLFPFSRLQADLVLFSRHHVMLLYQPLTLETVVPIQSNFRYDQQDFTTGDGTLALKYGFGESLISSISSNPRNSISEPASRFRSETPQLFSEHLTVVKAPFKTTSVRFQFSNLNLDIHGLTVCLLSSKETVSMRATASSTAPIIRSSAISMTCRYGPGTVSLQCRHSFLTFDSSVAVPKEKTTMESSPLTISIQSAQQLG